MTGIEFVDELPSTHPNGRTGGRPDVYSGIVAELKAHPGRWAKVRTYSDLNNARSMAGYVRRRFPGVEAKARGFDIYARWPADSSNGKATK